MDHTQNKLQNAQVAMQPLEPKTCDRCGGPMRLVGTEPHPVYEQTDLFTFACAECDGVQVTSVPLQPPAV